jgi:hypothetical protein
MADAWERRDAEERRNALAQELKKLDRDLKYDDLIAKKKQVDLEFVGKRKTKRAEDEAVGMCKRRRTEETSASRGGGCKKKLIKEERDDDERSVSAMAEERPDRDIRYQPLRSYPPPLTLRRPDDPYPARDHRSQAEPTGKPTGKLGIFQGCYGPQGVTSGMSSDALESDLKSAPADILLIQGAQASVLTRLQSASAMSRSQHQFRVCAYGAKASVAVCCRRKTWERVECLSDWTGKPPEGIDDAYPSELLAARCVAKFSTQRSGMEDLVVLSANLDLVTTQLAKGLRDGGRNANDGRVSAQSLSGMSAIETFVKALVFSIKRYKVRVFGGNFGMALFDICEMLREYKVQVNMAAWFPWVPAVHEVAQNVASDTCGIFVVGECVDLRMAHIPVVLSKAYGRPSWIKGVETVNVSKYTRDGGGPHNVWDFLGPGTLDSCRAKLRAVTDNSKPLRDTMDWAPLPACTGKPLTNVHTRLFSQGVSWPLVAFFGNRSNRTPEAMAKRKAIRDQRSFNTTRVGGDARSRARTRQRPPSRSTRDGGDDDQGRDDRKRSPSRWHEQRFRDGSTQWWYKNRLNEWSISSW